MSTLNPQFNAQPAVHCRLTPNAAFAFATHCVDRINVTGVVRNGAGDYTITTGVSFPTARGWSVTLTMITAPVPVAGWAGSIAQLTGNTFRLTVATGGALADIAAAFDITMQALTGDVA